MAEARIHINGLRNFSRKGKNSKQMMREISLHAEAENILAATIVQSIKRKCNSFIPSNIFRHWLS